MTPIRDANFDAHVRALLDRHACLSVDPESPDVAAAEFVMESVWDKLSEPQRAAANGLSSDLSWVRRLGAPPPKGRVDGTTVEAGRAFDAAKSAGDYFLALHLLRPLWPALTGEQLAAYRADLYFRAGLWAVSAVFSAFQAGLEANRPCSR